MIICFYPGSTSPYLSMKFAIEWDLDYEYHDSPMYVSTPVRVFLCVGQVYHACFTMFMGFKTLVDLVIQDL